MPQQYVAATGLGLAADTNFVLHSEVVRYRDTNQSVAENIIPPV